MKLNPGTNIGPYEVVSPLGAGGMGEVYRARDPRLRRDVAIKALPAAFAADTDRLARFEREAKLLASLSHPNIAGIHGLEEVGAERYLVLEFVEGETLADRIARGPLSVDEIVEIGKRIAEGVEAAHENGIIHRDLKPSNVMLTPSGTVKVLDFGLARADTADASGSNPSLTASPTLTHAATHDGVILGTAAYMSPEQARGRPVDRRTDVWSFGAVLYECLTGRPLYDGETVSDLIARILEREPDWSALPANTPRRLHALLERCLCKDARERLRDIGEARIALDSMMKGEVAHEETQAPAGPKSRRSMVVPVGLVLATAIVSIVATRLSIESPAPREVSLSVMLPPGDRLDAGGVENSMLALAPDGRSIAYIAEREETRRIFLRRLDERETMEIRSHDNARNPFFSPDGEWIGFFANRRLWKVSVRGGVPVELAEAAGDRSGVWLEDGTIVYTPSFTTPLYRIDEGGGAPSAITELDSTRNERSHRWPGALPGGEWIVFTVGEKDSPGGYEDSDIDVVSLRTGERRTVARGSYARYAPGGWLVIARGGSLHAMPIDPGDPGGGATPLPVLGGVLGVATSGVAFFDISRDGTLVFVPGREVLTSSRFAWVDRNGSSVSIPGVHTNVWSFDISPDGTRALAEVGPGGGSNHVYLVDLEHGSMNQITFGLGAGSPRWLPDGEHFVCSRRSGSGRDEIVLSSVTGRDSVRVLASSDAPLIVTDVRPDGRTVLYQPYGVQDSDLFEVPTNGGPSRTAVAGARSQVAGIFSPDGEWIAYVSDDEVFVTPVGRVGGRLQITSGGGRGPVWSPDGKELYYISGGMVMATRLAHRDGAVFADTTERLFPLTVLGGDSSIRGYDLHPSGEKFLVRVGENEPLEMREISVHVGWAATLASAVGGAFHR